MDRADLKAHAKASMSWVKPHPAWITLVYMLLTGSINLVVQIDYDKIFRMASGFIDPFDFWGTRAPTVALMLIAFGLIISVIEAGYIKYCIRISRGQPAGFGTLFELVSSIFRFIGLNFLMGLVVGGSIIVCMIPALVLVAIIPGLGAVAALLMLAGFILPVYLALGYSQAIYFAVDDPEMKVTECLRESRSIMRGRKGEYFVLSLSFFPWMFLVVITAGIASLWVTPYMNVTMAGYFNHLVDYTPHPGDQGPPPPDHRPPSDWYNQ